MYRILPDTKGRIIAIHIEGYMSAHDYKTLLPYIKKRIEQEGALRFFIDLKDFKGVEMVGALKAIPHSFKYNRYIEKEALITDEEWIYTWVKLLSPLFKTKIRCFPSAHVEKAWEWLRK